MPKVKPDDTVTGSIEPMFHWETRIPHTVVLMLKSNEEDLILKACQSLYKFARGGDLNQNLLVQYDVLILLLVHLEHTNRNVRRMSAMTLAELSSNNSVQSVLVSPENVVRLVRILRQDDDCVVDEMASRALLRLSTDASGRAMLLRSDAVHALTHRLISKDPDVLKNCLDTLLAVLGSTEAIEGFVESKGVPNALELIASEYPVLQKLALWALQKAMLSADGRVHIREVGGLEKLLAILENRLLEDLYSGAVEVLHEAVTDLDNILAIHDFGGLKKILTFVELVSSPEVLGQCAFLLAKMASQEPVREILHELEIEPVLVDNLLGSGYAPGQNGAARTIGHMCLMLESQETLVRLEAVKPLLAMAGSPETYQAAVVGLAAATHNHQLACRQVGTPENLERIAGRLGINDEEAVSHAALTLRNVSDNEALRPIVAASCAPEKLVDCLESDSSLVLVSACDCLEVLCVSVPARRRVVDCGATDLFMDLLEHDDAVVRDACVRALQVVGKDFQAAEQLCSGGAVGSLRRLRASDTLRIILEVDLSALYAIFGHLRPRHKIYDLFYDCGRQKTCDVVPELADLLEEPLSITRTVFLIHSGVCPFRSEDQPAAHVKKTSDESLDPEKVEEKVEKEAKPSGETGVPEEAQKEANIKEEKEGQDATGPSTTKEGVSGSQERQSQDETSAIDPQPKSSQPQESHPPIPHPPESQAQPCPPPDSQPSPESQSPLAPPSDIPPPLRSQQPTNQTMPSQEPEFPSPTTSDPPESQPPATQSSTSQEPASQSPESQPPESQSPESHSQDYKPLESHPSESEQSESQPLETLPPVSQLPDYQSSDSQPSDHQPSESQPTPLQPPAPVPPPPPEVTQVLYIPPKPDSIYPPPDPRLQSYVEQVKDKIEPLPCDRAQSAALAEFVSARLGGSVPAQHLGTWSTETHICMLKRRTGTNVVSLGDVERGGLRCRSLLFKFLADQIGLPCALRRGAGGRYWVSVLLRGEGEMAAMGPYLETVVDLIHEPGRLMLAESAEAVEYTIGFESR